MAYPSKGCFMRLILSRDTRTLLDIPLAVGRNDLHKILLENEMKQDEQIDVAWTDADNREHHALSFVPRFGLSAVIRGNSCWLSQCEIEFANIVADYVYFTLVPRSTAQMVGTCFNCLDIVQLQLLNRFACPEDLIDLSVRYDDFTKYMFLDSPSAIITIIQNELAKKKLVFLQGRQFMISERLAASSTDGHISITSDSEGSAPLKLQLFSVLQIYSVVKPEIFNFKLVTNPFFRIAAMFQEVNLLDDHTSQNSLIRRAFVLARYGIYWSEAFALFKDLSAPAKKNLFTSINKLLFTKFPVNLEKIKTGDESENSTNIELATNTYSLHDRNCAEFFDIHKSLRFILEPLNNIFGNYQNDRQQEAPMNAQLWTPLLDCLLLPDDNDTIGRLSSTVELPLNVLPGSVVDRRIDYAIVSDRQLPLVIAEYASSQGRRGVHKDFPKALIEAEMFLLDFIGRHRELKFARLLRLICCFVMFIVADEVEFGVLRPIFDDGMKLKGFAFTSNKRFRFRLVLPDGTSATDEEELDSQLFKDLFSDNIYPLSGVSETLKKGVRTFKGLEASIKNLKTIPLAENIRKRPCPVSFDMTKLDLVTLRFLRTFGIFLNKYAERLATLIDAAGPPDDPLLPGLALRADLQRNVYSRSIVNKTPKDKMFTTTDPLKTPTKKRKTKQRMFHSLMNMALRTPYGYRAKLIRRPSDSLVIRGTAASPVQPRKAVFLWKSDCASETYFMKVVASQVSKFVPVIVFLKTFSIKDMVFVGMERLESVAEAFAAGWWSNFDVKLTTFIIDVVLAIEGLWRNGWIHGNIRPDKIMYSKATRRWKLAFSSTMRPINATCEPAHSGNFPYVDPNVFFKYMPKSMQSELYSLGACLKEMTEESNIPTQLRLCVEDISPFQEMAKFLMSRPNLSEALQKVYELGKAVLKECNKMKRCARALSRHPIDQLAQEKPVLPSVEIPVSVNTPQAQKSQGFVRG